MVILDTANIASNKEIFTLTKEALTPWSAVKNDGVGGKLLVGGRYRQIWIWL